jgi:hypothetical protein
LVLEAFNNSIISASIAMLCCIAGIPLTLFLRREHLRDCSVTSCALSPIFGLALVLVVTENFLGFGANFDLTARFLGLAYVVLITVFLFRIVNEVKSSSQPLMGALIELFRNVTTKILNLIALIVLASFVMTMSKSGHSLVNLRIGIDSGLYTDAAQLLLESNGLNFKDSLSGDVNSFGVSILDLYLVHGVPFFLALVTKAFNFRHSYEAVIPMLSVLLGTISGLTKSFACQIGLGKRLAQLLGILIVFNYPLIHLALESQWPNLMAISVNLAILVFLLGTSYSGKQIQPRVVSGLALLTCLSLITYSVYLPIWIMFLFIFSIIKLFALKHLRTAKKFLNLAFGFIFGFLLAPHFIMHENFLKFFSTIAGYPTPHIMLPQDILGFASIWTDWGRWIQVGYSPISVSRENVYLDFTLATFIVGFLTYVGVRVYSVKSIPPIWLPSTLILTLTALRLNSRFSHLIGFDLDPMTHRGYIWSKSVGQFVPIFLTMFFIGILVVTSKQISIQRILVVVFSVVVLFTGIKGVLNFRNSSFPLSKDALDVNEFLLSHEKCLILLRPRGHSVGGEKMMMLDRVFDYSVSSIFRHNPVIENGEPLNFKGNLDDLGERVCVLIDLDRGGLDALTAVGEKHLVYRNKHWIIFDGGETFSILKESGANAYFDILGIPLKGD